MVPFFPVFRICASKGQPMNSILRFYSLLKASNRRSMPPMMEKLKLDFAARSRPSLQPPDTAHRLIRKARSAARGNEYSPEAAPKPAAALSKERARPKENASAGERISTSSVLAASGVA